MLNNKVSKAVRLAIAFSAASTAAFSVNSFAADEEGAEKVERIEVTGSRIKRTDVEGVSPVVSISRADIDVSGELSVADVLRDTNMNSFGSFSESSGYGSGAQGTATVSLRGMGSGRTLVLVDGKRLAPSPGSSGSTSDLNTIPFAAVERIDIVTDGASAIYGSDAVGGVINIVLKKDFDGFNLTAQTQRPEAKGGDQDSVSFTYGANTDKGNIIMSLEHDVKGIIFTRDRDYLKASIADTFQDSTGISQGARNINYTIKNADGTYRSEIRPARLNGESLCDDRFVGIMPDGRSNYPDSTVCPFDHTQFSAQTAKIERTNFYTFGRYNLTDEIDLNISSIAMRKATFGRFAPAVGSFNITGTQMANESIELAEGEEIYSAAANWRFIDNGNRDGRSEELMLDFKIGLDSMTDWGNWTVGMHRNLNRINEHGTGYVNQVFAEQFAKEGTLTDPRSIALMQHTTIVDNKSDYTNYHAGIGFDSLAELPGGDLGIYIHSEYTKTNFSRTVDPLSDANAVIGSAGGSTIGERTAKAVAIEAALPVLDNLDVTVAARYDSYSDFGSKVSPQIGVKYDFIEGYAVRSSWGKGFAAPDYGSLFTKSQGFPWTFVEGEGWSQIEQNSIGNPNLKAEESETFNIGFIGQITDNVSFTVDYYTIALENEVTAYSRYRILDDVEDGLTSPAPNRVEFNAAGSPERFFVSYINDGKTEQKGIDFSIKGAFETDFGTFSAKFDYNHIIEFKTPYDGDLSNLVDRIGLTDRPETRWTARIGYSIEDHSINLTAKYTDSQLNDSDYDEKCKCFVVDPDAVDTDNTATYIDSHKELDLRYNYNVSQDLSVNFGVRNLTDELPEFSDPITQSRFSAGLYSIQGRVVYGGFSFNF
jgi:iron complex outermembrane receptor protein